ncbi:LOW QUALITY PROTEIN: hypothetical protein CVT26_007079 [Gymnopilus dilepis]|uniref:Uncharacterized protein n=1 Tax=Gymnopilus dilepis TaxID=231916 RepID=A0A409VNI9_9AGAR|nr:LOW QUALITY PROTEIN: hypothetical protein CVT26_007079 [Gymnopilus dilepis]
MKERVLTSRELKVGKGVLIPGGRKRRKCCSPPKKRKKKGKKIKRNCVSGIWWSLHVTRMQVLPTFTPLEPARRKYQRLSLSSKHLASRGVLVNAQMQRHSPGLRGSDLARYLFRTRSNSSDVQSSAVKSSWKSGGNLLNEGNKPHPAHNHQIPSSDNHVRNANSSAALDKRWTGHAYIGELFEAE